MQHNDFRFELKSVSEADGSFTGLASTYGNVDLGNDEVIPGAFSKTLRDAKGPWPLLAGHDPKEQIGLRRVARQQCRPFSTGQIKSCTRKKRVSLMP
jgi:hypothetical protein